MFVYNFQEMCRILKASAKYLHFEKYIQRLLRILKLLPQKNQKSGKKLKTRSNDSVLAEH